jgi:hypothetical protein
MARINITALMEAHELTPAEMAAILWPDATQQTPRVLIGRWLTRPVVSIRLDQLQELHDRFPNDEIIDYGTRI